MKLGLTAEYIRRSEVAAFTPLEPGVFSFGPLAWVAGSIPLVFYICCIAGVLRQERSQRSLFMLYYALQSVESTLARDNAFRQYRDVMRANREQVLNVHMPDERTDGVLELEPDAEQEQQYRMERNTENAGKRRGALTKGLKEADMA